MGDKNEVLANFQVGRPLGRVVKGSEGSCGCGCFNWNFTAFLPSPSPVQALSGIEDIGICLDVLEQKEWDLTVRAPLLSAAVHTALASIEHRHP